MRKRGVRAEKERAARRSENLFVCTGAGCDLFLNDTIPKDGRECRPCRSDERTPPAETRMMEETDQVQTKAELSRPEDRRVRVRFAEPLKTYCQRGEGDLDQIWWIGQTRDVSASGIGLLIPQRFEPDTVLTLELENRRQNLSRTVQVRVVHAVQQSGGLWLLGCVFTEELTNPDLVALLG